MLSENHMSCPQGRKNLPLVAVGQISMPASSHIGCVVITAFILSVINLFEGSSSLFQPFDDFHGVHCSVRNSGKSFLGLCKSL